MKTAKEILDEHGCPNIPFDENVTMYYPAILEAMEEYAKQYDKEFCPLCENAYPRLLPSGRWYCDDCEIKWW